MSYCNITGLYRIDRHASCGNWKGCWKCKNRYYSVSNCIKIGEDKPPTRFEPFEGEEWVVA